MLRGIDKSEIFSDDEDRIKFIEKLKKAKEVGKIEVYRYCLMDNHIHILIKLKRQIKRPHVFINKIKKTD